MNHMNNIEYFNKVFSFLLYTAVMKMDETNHDRSNLMTILVGLSQDLPGVNLAVIKDKVNDLKKYDHYSDEEVNTELVEICKGKAILHSEWLLLAGRVKMHYIKKITPSTFSKCTQILKPALDDEYYNFVMRNKNELDDIIVSDRDYDFKIFGVMTLLDGRLGRLKVDGKSILAETPQYAYLRIATFLWYSGKRGFGSIEKIKEMYTRLSLGQTSPSSPSLMNAGMRRPQLASCFTLAVGDNMEEISKSWKDTAIISMNCGGVGIDFSSLRHSEIGHYGQSSGVVPWIKIQEQILKTVDQGGRRQGSGTAYLSDWHIDIENFVDMRLPTGDPKMRAPDLTYDVWISDMFMKRVEANEEWTLFCPNKAKMLETKWGVEFDMAYLTYERKVQEGKIKRFRKIKARDLWQKILLNQIETGMPFIHYKDACNRKCNQNNLGTIRLSNLCGEILLYTDKDNIGSCNLGSISLNTCVKEDENGRKYFDFDMLGYLTSRITRDVDRTIDRTYYPPDIPQIESTNKANRPLGIGVQGLDDVFALLDISWLSEEARDLNKMIFETMYYFAVKESVELAVIYGAYENFEGSMASQGFFQFDLWDLEKCEKDCNKDLLEVLLSSEKCKGPDTDRYDWRALREDMKKYGMRNSLLIALMPTASSSGILDNNECFEPRTSHVYARTTKSGQFLMVNEHLVRDLEEIGLWTTEVVRNIWANGGKVTEISEEGLEGEKLERLKFLKEKYLIAFQLPQKRLLDMMLDRGRYVCQTQSFNCYMSDPTYAKLNAFHFHGWKGGACTGLYYLHQPAKINPSNISLDNIVIPQVECTDDICISCSM